MIKVAVPKYKQWFIPAVIKPTNSLLLDLDTLSLIKVTGKEIVNYDVLNIFWEDTGWYIDYTKCGFVHVSDQVRIESYGQLGCISFNNMRHIFSISPIMRSIGYALFVDDVLRIKNPVAVDIRSGLGGSNTHYTTIALYTERLGSYYISRFILRGLQTGSLITNIFMSAYFSLTGELLGITLEDFYLFISELGIVQRDKFLYRKVERYNLPLALQAKLSIMGGGQTFAFCSSSIQVRLEIAFTC